MNTTLWVLQGLLAALFAGAGILKATASLDSLEAKVGGWVHDVPMPIIRTVGVLEVLAAVGLVVPAAADVAPWLTWLAAVGLVGTMAGAVVTHGRRGEVKDVVVNVALAALLGVVVWGRLGPYSF